MFESKVTRWCVDCTISLTISSQIVTHPVQGKEMNMRDHEHKSVSRASRVTLVFYYGSNELIIFSTTDVLALSHLIMTFDLSVV